MVEKNNLTEKSLKKRRWNLIRRHGITPEQYHALFNAQNGVCAICLQPETMRSNLSVDHNHMTGVVRSLLCHRCNVAVGLVKERPRVALAIALYVLPP